MSDPAGRKLQPLQLADGSAVRVRTTTYITSKKAKTGDKLALRVASDVKIGDLVIIPRGALATGHIASAQKNRRMGRPGTLVLEIDSVEAFTGKLDPLRAAASRRGQGYSGQIADTAVGMGLPTMGIGAIFAVPLLLFKGENAQIPAATTLLAYVDGDALFDEAELRPLQPPGAPATGLATFYVLRSQTQGDKTPAVYCGHVEIGTLKKRHFVEVRVPPGEYEVRSPRIKRNVRFTAEADHTYYIHFYPNSFLSGGFLELMDSIAADDLVAFSGWITDPQVDLTGADPAKLADVTPLPGPDAEK